MSLTGRWLPALAGAIALSSANPCAALDPARQLNQLYHTGWTAESGAPPDERALAQTPDGFLWIGAGSGLFRFDGVHFERAEPQGDLMPTVAVSALLAMPSGDLWIAYDHGHVARLRNGILQNMSEGLPPGGPVGLARDNHNTVWAYIGGDGHAGLARFVNGRWRIVGTDWGLPSGGVRAMLPASDGALWVECKDRLFLLRPGAHRFEDTGQTFNGTSLTEGPDGRIWSTARPASRHAPWNIAFPDFEKSPHAEPVSGLYSSAPPNRSLQNILVDRDRNFWASSSEGVLRISAKLPPKAPKTSDSFSASSGLTSSLAGPLLEDREGDIWVGTSLGLDRFRAVDVVAAAGIPLVSPLGFWQAADKAGGVFIATGDTLFRAYPDRPAEVIFRSRDESSAYLFTDADGALWIGRYSKLARLAGDHVEPIRLPSSAAGDPVYITQDRSGSIWLSVRANGVFRQKGTGWTRADVSVDPLQPAPDQLLIDNSDRIWMKFHGELWSFDGGKYRNYSEKDGLSVGHVQLIYAGKNNVFIGGDFGLSRFDGRRFQTLTSKRVPDFLRITGVVQTARGDTWINGINGVVVVRTKILNQAFDNSNVQLRYRLFTFADGLPGVAQQDSDSPTALESTDGRVWFVTNHGVAWIDPAHLIHNPLPPPVTIRSVTTGGRTYAAHPGLELPPGSANLQIDYTALSLTAPERVRFRYRLDGVDRAWIDPGIRRQAFYTNLGSGRYRFHLIAENNDGVWSKDGATIEFVIKPTFFQSYWFALLCVLSGVLFLWGAYFVRLRQLTERIRSQLEVRLTERERIARELHDTLLQGFQGLVLRFQAVAQSIPPAGSAQRLMEDALVSADKVLVEGRERILDLRSADRTLDLSEAIADMAAKPGVNLKAEFRVIVEGEARPITPLASSEILKICQEALFNACRHAEARNIEVSVTYHSREFGILFRDDGTGISREVMAEQGKSGHFGLAGMRERAAALRGRLVITTFKGSGTEIGLRVPAQVAYADYVGQRWRSILSRIFPRRQ